MKDELLDFWDSIPIRWRSLKKNPSKVLDGFIILASLNSIVLMAFNPTSNVMLILAATATCIGVVKCIWWNLR